jgi:cyclin L
MPTIVSAAILLTVRHLGLSLPDLWWELFDAEWEDLWSVCGSIMRLYRDRPIAERARVHGMLNKKDIRKWLEEHGEVGGEIEP